MFEPDTRISVVNVIVVLNYIIFILLGMVLGHSAARYFSSLGTIVGGLLGAWWAFWTDFFFYTTFIRVDEILLELRGGVKIFYGKTSGNLASSGYTENLVDIKEALERNTAEVASQTQALTKLVEMLAASREGSADTKAKDDTSALIASASSKAIPDELKALIEEKGDVNAKNSEGKTALMLAAAGNAGLDEISALIEAKADVNLFDENGVTALMYAAIYSTNIEVIKALVDAGSDVNARGNSGKRPIELLDDRDDKDTFVGTDAYWKMRSYLI